MRLLISRLGYLSSCLLALLLIAWAPGSSTKEIEATHEWTLLGENDTVAAGMHIRMDMTTGERWVKLPDDEDSSSNSTDVVVANDGSTENVSSDPQHDFDMMYRALSRLPDAEKVRIQFDESIAGDHEKLLELWNTRQAELRDFELLDLPQVLKNTIKCLKTFLEQPVQQLADIGESEGSSGGILQVLLDLEYHLQDIDMTRDFHTLGGWPVLASLLSDTILQQAVAADDSGTTLDLNEAVDAFQRVQSTAAWALGTAVKNTEEFHPFVVERSVDLGGEKASALDLVINQLATGSSPVEKQIKLVYCLGSFLRGNPLAQDQFRQTASPRLLAQLLRESFTSPKLHNKLLQLVTDLRQESNSGPVLTVLCDTIGDPRSSEVARPETYVQTISVFAGSCMSWDHAAIMNRISGMTAEAEGMETELRNEHMERIQTTLRKLEQTKPLVS